MFQTGALIGNGIIDRHAMISSSILTYLTRKKSFAVSTVNLEIRVEAGDVEFVCLYNR